MASKEYEAILKVLLDAVQTANASQANQAPAAVAAPAVPAGIPVGISNHRNKIWPSYTSCHKVVMWC